jgi:hypothetical protein
MNKTKKRYLAGLFGVHALCMLPCSSILFVVFVLLAAKFMEPLVVLQHADGKWHEGFKSFEQGKLYYTAQQYNDALRSFDVAVELGLKKADLFAARGGLLAGIKVASRCNRRFHQSNCVRPIRIVYTIISVPYPGKRLATKKDLKLPLIRLFFCRRETANSIVCTTTV